MTELLDILKDCGLLAILVVLNIMASTYYNVNVKDIKFDKIKMLNGIKKAVIIGLLFTGLTFVYSQFDAIVVPMINAELKPDYIMDTALAVYFIKCAKDLIDCLGLVEWIKERLNKSIEEAK